MKRPLLAFSCWLLAPAAFAILDTNNNGTSDFWERDFNNGSLFDASFDPQADEDSDGWTNAQEAEAGSNPFDPNPPDGMIRLITGHVPAEWSEPDEYNEVHPVTAEAVTVTWPTLAGKQYTLLFSPDLTEGSWLPVGSPFIAQGGETTYGFDISQADKCFWRVTVADVDSDYDGLTNYEELRAGTNPYLEDSDSDTLSDWQEFMAGTDPLNQDTDGDGIPDPIDGAPLVSAITFADADGDGIPDGADANPNDPRGPAPSVASENASGNPLSNLIKDETVKFVLTVSNPAGAAPTATDLTFFLNGTEETTSISAIGGPVGSSQRFLLTWVAETTANYPTLTIQNLTLRFRDSEQATSWLNLARIDVAEWEGKIITLPYVSSEESWGYEVMTHLSGMKEKQHFVARNEGANLVYRGPKTMKVINSNGGVSDLQLPAAAIPFLKISGTPGGSPDVVEQLDYATLATGMDVDFVFNNGSAKSLQFELSDAGINTTLSPGQSHFQGVSLANAAFPLNTGAVIRYLDGTEWIPFLSSIWPVASATDANSRILRSVNVLTTAAGQLDLHGVTNYMVRNAKITPHASGTVEYPGLPQESVTSEYDKKFMPIGAEEWRKIVIKIYPPQQHFTYSKGYRLNLGTGTTGDAAPQAGWMAQTQSGGTLSALTIPTDGKIEILATDTNLYPQLTSPEGLVLFLKRSPAVDHAHVLSLDILPIMETNNPERMGSLNLLPVELVPDYNRDGIINDTDRNHVSDGNPWRFWINDDNDSGETGGNDYYSSPWPDINLADGSVNGVRDLVDFFPLRLDIKAALESFPAGTHDYYLRQDYDTQRIPATWGKAGSGYIEWPEADPAVEPGSETSQDAYLRNVTTARMIATRAVIPVREDPLSEQLNQGGTKLSEDLLAAASIGKGLVLIEGKNRNSNPIILDVRDSQGRSVFELPFHVNFTSVEDMFRHKYVMPNAATLTQNDIPGSPSNWPDADRNDKHFVFVHGYNVSGDQSRGWGAEMFKRLYWSGSNARFSNFAWWGNQSQVAGISPNYQVNLVHAFDTAKSFAQFLNLIDGDKTVAAHSMGNILVGSAMHDWGARPENYLMLNSAAAKESYDATEAGDITQDEMMENLAWRGYPKALRASEWHNLPSPAIWPANDKRRDMTWRSRLGGVIANGGQTDVYNFYSSGEEVLNNPTLTDPATNGAIAEPWLKANKVWAVQEKRKGYGITGHIHSSNYGGWLFNLLPYNSDLHVPDTGNPWGNHRMRSPSELPQPLSNQWLLERTLVPMSPFFNRSYHDDLYHQDTGVGTTGSDYAEEHRDTLISEMIPCTTFAAGKNEFLDPVTAIPEDRNIDMNVRMKTDLDEWPLTDEFKEDDSDPPVRNWLHSDIKVKAFTHNWKAYEKFTEIGNLK